MRWEPVIGLEVHVQLRTETKLFCRCSSAFGAEPNTQVCPVCLGYPGSLPVLNRQAVDQAVRLALALSASVRERSVFARKNYFYPDLPKGYQISQFDRPLAERGALPFEDPAGSGARTLELERLHLEEDAGKLLHEVPGGGALPGLSLVDFNRCGMPLVEIVSAPALRSPAEAEAALRSLHQVLRYTETSDANLEEGSLRCDANVSVRAAGETRLGTKVEIKNINSFRNVARALEYDIERQQRLLERGEAVAQETRGFDAATGQTASQRGKEEAQDYRYFPEPDLGPLAVSAERRAALAADLPEMPWRRRARFLDEYALPADAAGVLTSDRELGDYFERVVELSGGDARGVANWILTDVLRELNQRQQCLAEGLSAAALAELLRMVAAGELSTTAGKQVLAEIWESGEEPGAAVERLGLAQVRNEEQIDAWVESVLAEHPKPVAQLRDGEQKVLGFLLGQVMRLSSGSADPQLVRRRILEQVRE